MATQVENPLTEADYQRIIDGIAQAEKAIAQTEMADRAGIPTGDAMVKAKQSRDQLLKIKNTYFPGR